MDRENLIFLSETDSTNSRLKALAAQGAAHGTVLWTKKQSGGRGRLGRSFESPEGGLYLSVLWRPELPAEACLSLSPLAAVAVRRGVEEFTGIALDIKWPNDLLFNGKKLCGILSEMVFAADGSVAVVVGVGLNVNTSEKEFSEDVRSVAGSLRSETGKAVDADAMCAKLICCLDAAYEEWRRNRGFFLEEYRRHCVNVGREVYVIRDLEKRSAFAEGINEDFSLCVRYPDGKSEHISFGEVSIRM